MGHGASLATEVDSQVRALISDMNAFNEALLAANAGASQGLNAKASQAVTEHGGGRRSSRRCSPAPSRCG